MTPSPERSDYILFVCPECGEQSRNYRSDDTRPVTYCLNHEDEPERIKRPQHVPVHVPRSFVAELQEIVQS